MEDIIIPLILSTGGFQCREYGVFDQPGMIRCVTHGAIEIIEFDSFRELRSVHNSLSLNCPLHDVLVHRERYFITFKIQLQ